MKFREGVYSLQSSTPLDDTEVDDNLDDDQEAGDDADADGDGQLPDEFDDFDAILDRQEREAEQEMERAIKALEHPEAPRVATGPELWIGFDGEWFKSGEDENTILTIQLYVPPEQACFRMQGHDEAPESFARKLGRLSCMVKADGPAPHQRPELSRALQRIVTKAIELGLIAEEPAVIVVVGFGLRFDLAALRDFQELKREVDVVAGRVATVNAHAELSLNWRQRVRPAKPADAGLGDVRVPVATALTSGDGMGIVRMKVRFIDAAAYVPIGTSLRWVGKLVGREKLEIPAPYSIERMDEYLRKQPAAFEAYAMRDAEIAVLFGMRIRNFAQQRLGLGNLSPTASGLALKWFLRTIPKEDRLAAFGLRKVRHEAWHQASRKRKTFTQVEPTPMRSLQDPLTTLCFKGGRNEAFWLGPSDPTLGPIWDYDLAGAYTQALLDLKRLDFEHPRFSTSIDDYLGHVAGYALVEFKHPPGTRFPVFSVAAGSKGLIFPMEGLAYATAPEIMAAHGVGCEMTIRWGVIYPWLGTPAGTDGEEDPRQRLFYTFVKGVREMRKQLKDEEKARAEELGEDPRSDLIEEQFVKLLGNSLTGKCSQGLRPKNVYDSRGARSVQLRPSPITNPAIAAHITGFIRAVLAEILNRIPRQHVVISATTDGFLTSAPRQDIDLTGPLSRRFQRLCWWVIPGSEMLEVKHAAQQVVCMKTRGQLTSKAMPGQRIVVAKAGVQPTVRITRKMTPEQIRQAQNDELLRMYLERTPESMVSSRSFPSLRDQWEKGVDLVKAERHIRMSLEFDLKRKLVDAREVPVLGWNTTHVSAGTVPWNTVQEFERARARLDQFRSPPRPPSEENTAYAIPTRRRKEPRKARCLKTVADLHDLDSEVVRGLMRDFARAAGLPVMNLGKDGPEGMLKRAFLRVYTRSEMGLVRRFTYTQMAQWLTDYGLATTTQEVKTARQQPVVLACVPRTLAVMRLLQELEGLFPDADMRPLLVPYDDDAEPDDADHDDDD